MLGCVFAKVKSRKGWLLGNKLEFYSNFPSQTIGRLNAIESGKINEIQELAGSREKSDEVDKSQLVFVSVCITLRTYHWAATFLSFTKILFSSLREANNYQLKGISPLLHPLCYTSRSSLGVIRCFRPTKSVLITD